MLTWKYFDFKSASVETQSFFCCSRRGGRSKAAVAKDDSEDEDEEEEEEQEDEPTPKVCAELPSDKECIH